MDLEVDQLKAITPDAVIDARGSACPGPLLEAKKGIGTVSVGGTIEIRSDAAESRNDIPIWANKVGHEWLGAFESEEGYDRIFVRRGK